MEPDRPATTEVLGTWLHHREVGDGRPVVLLHGNPTSSLLWRHVLRRVEQEDTGHRWLALDLVGMGASGPSRSGYRFLHHLAHVEAWLRALGLDDVVLVGHDWGAVLALQLLHRGGRAVRGAAVMEAHLWPLPGWEAMDPGGRSLFQQLRTPGVGEQMVLDHNFFLDTLLPAALGERLSEADLAAYAAPYPDPASRLPLLRWAREIPVAGEPADVAEAVRAAAEGPAVSRAPVLLLVGQPGVLVTPAVVERCRRSWRGLQVVDVGGPAGHFLPEDRPEEVADALLGWARTLP